MSLVRVHARATIPTHQFISVSSLLNTTQTNDSYN